MKPSDPAPQNTISKSKPFRGRIKMGCNFESALMWLNPLIRLEFFTFFSSVVAQRVDWLLPATCGLSFFVSENPMIDYRIEYRHGRKALRNRRLRGGA